MATLTGQNVVDRAWTLVQDTQGGTGVRWPAAEMLMWVNDGQREVVLHKPSSCVKALQVQLAEDTRQTFEGLAAINSSGATALLGGLQVIDIVRNISPNKRAIRVITREVLDAQRPNWHSETTTDSVLHWTYDPRAPKVFYCYPRPAAGAAMIVEMVFSASPAELGNLSNVISVDDIFANALGYYVLFRAYSKDAEYTQNAQLAAGYYQMFMGALTGKTAAESSDNPNMSMAPFNPNVPA